MRIRDLNRRLDKLLSHAKSKLLGILPIIESIDIDTLERWETVTPEERDRYRVDNPEAETMHSTEPLTAIVVCVHLPVKDEIWRWSHKEPDVLRAKPHIPSFESPM